MKFIVSDTDDHSTQGEEIIKGSSGASYNRCSHVPDLQSKCSD